MKTKVGDPFADAVLPARGVTKVPHPVTKPICLTVRSDDCEVRPPRYLPECRREVVRSVRCDVHELERPRRRAAVITPATLGDLRPLDAVMHDSNAVVQISGIQLAQMFRHRDGPAHRPSHSSVDSIADTVDRGHTGRG